MATHVFRRAPALARTRAFCGAASLRPGSPSCAMGMAALPVPPQRPALVERRGVGAATIAVAAVAARPIGAWRAFHGAPICATEQVSASEFGDFVVHLVRGKKNYVIVGTTHTSPESVALVKEAMETLRPDTLVIELDEARARAIRESYDSPGNQLLTSLMELGARIASGMPTSRYGLEFKTAMDIAERNGTQVIYGDVNAESVLEAFTFSDMFKMAFNKKNIEADAGAGNGRQRARREVEKMEEVSPKLAEALVHKRDEALARSLWDAPGRLVVAVVGLGHLDGIMAWWHRLADEKR